MVAEPPLICGCVPFLAAGSSKLVDHARCPSSVGQQMAECKVPPSETTVPLGDQNETMSGALVPGTPTELASGMAGPGEPPLEETGEASGHGADCLDEPDVANAPTVAPDAADDNDWVGWWKHESDE
jgi:hypothetical protein